MIDAKSWGTNIRLSSTVGDPAGRSIILFVVLLLWLLLLLLLVLLLLLSFSLLLLLSSSSSSAYYGASDYNNKRQCYRLSMPKGSSGDAAVKSPCVLVAPICLAVLGCCGNHMFPRHLDVLPAGTSWACHKADKSYLKSNLVYHYELGLEIWSTHRGTVVHVQVQTVYHSDTISSRFPIRVRIQYIFSTFFT